jgi:hypothetical protein
VSQVLRHAPADHGRRGFRDGDPRGVQGLGPDGADAGPYSQPSSLESKSREAVKEEVDVLRAVQWIGPEDGIQAIKDGTTDAIGADFEYDRGRAYEIIQKIKQGPEVLFSMPTEYRDIEVPVTDPDGVPAIDPMTGAPMMRKEMIQVPGWMPREVDNTAIHKAIFARWMKSAEWGMLDPGMREAARLYWRALG